MSSEIDLRELAEMTAQERVFLSVYMAGPQSLSGIEKRFERVRRVLKATVLRRTSGNISTRM